MTRELINLNYPTKIIKIGSGYIFFFEFGLGLKNSKFRTVNPTYPKIGFELNSNVSYL